MEWSELKLSHEIEFPLEWRSIFILLLPNITLWQYTQNVIWIFTSPFFSLYFDIANILRKADKFQSVWINFTFLKSAHVECTKISLRLNLMWKFVGNWHCNIHRARKIFKVMFLFSWPMKESEQYLPCITVYAPSGPNMWIY